jgi:hypothetical protein
MECYMKSIIVLSSRFSCLVLFVVVMAAGSGCNISWGSSPELTPIPEEPRTAGTDTIAVGLTQAVPSHTSQPEDNLPSPTITLEETVLEPTDVPIVSSQETPLPTPTVTSLPSPSATPIPQPTPTMEILFQDNFDATQGWYTYESDRFRMEYLSGKYHIFNNILNAAVNSVRTQNYDDIYLEVEAGKVAGPPNGYFGLVCRFQDDNNYYSLVIGSEGSYGIIRMMGGTVQFISQPARPTEAIRGGSAVNRIGGSCIGDRLTLYVNGVKVVEATDEIYSSGFIGLVVGTTSVPGLEVSFDNFKVKKP